MALKENKWFQNAIRMGVFIGADADLDLMKDFTGDLKNIIGISDLDILPEIIEKLIFSSTD